MADTPELEQIQKQTVHESTEHLHGPESIEYERDELIVLALVRNSKPYLKSFIEHYFSLGAKHLVFLDNGSTDDTVETIKRYENVTVLSTGLPFKRYGLSMRQYLVERFGKQRWSLLVDIDELFDYPFSDVVSLKALLRYLSENGYTAAVAHMLDMFPEEPLSEAARDDDASLKELHRFYDFSNINSFSYRAAEGVDNVVSNEDIEILQGGIQKTLFNLHPLLIKHPLVFYDGRVRPADLSEHWVGGARVADFSGVLFHYKLSKSLYDLVRREASEQRYINRHGKYEKYSKVLDSSPELLIKQDTSRELKSVNDLIGTRFACISREYMRLVQSESQGREASSQNVELDRVYDLFSRAKDETKEQFKREQRMRMQRNYFWRRLRETQEEVGSAKQRIRHLEGRKQDLERQIQAVQSSRTWRFLTILSRIKHTVLGKRS